jgi:signal transduction histidine kinase
VLFQPVRDRVQRFANRLVYGERATPYEVLSDFADRVGGSYDASELLPRMARTVAEGVAAARVEVWLAAQGHLTLEASWPSAEAEADDDTGQAPRVVQRAGELAGDRVVEVRHQGELLGVLTVLKPAGEPLNTAEEKLLDDVAAQAGLVLRNVRLIEDLRSSRERLVTTADGERRRLERNLHDGAQQSLVSVALMLNTARSRLTPDLEPSLGPALDQAAEQLRLAVDELRELARGIHPVILTERGLQAAISSLAERSPVPVQVDYRLDRRPPAPVEASLYFVVAEALTNVAKYADATGVTVTVTANATPAGGTELVLEVADDGIGGADATRGSGLRGLADRVAVVDGTLRVESPVGRGTTLTCTVPLRSTQAVPVLSRVAEPMVVSR